MIKVFLTDDHTLLAEALTTALNQTEDIRITRSFNTFHAWRHCISSFSLKTNDLQNLNLQQVTI